MEAFDYKSLVVDLEDMSRVNNSIWFPTEDDKYLMSESAWNNAMEEYSKEINNLIFNNIQVVSDSCDCYGGCCGHESWVHELHVMTADGIKKIEVIDDQFVFKFNDTYIYVHVDGKFNYADFIAICKFCGITLESNLYEI